MAAVTQAMRRAGRRAEKNASTRIVAASQAYRSACESGEHERHAAAGQHAEQAAQQPIYGEAERGPDVRLRHHDCRHHRPEPLREVEQVCRRISEARSYRHLHGLAHARPAFAPVQFARFDKGVERPELEVRSVNGVSLRSRYLLAHTEVRKLLS